MEDYLAASFMPHSHSAPLYLLYGLSASFPKHGLAPVHDDDDGGDDGFEFATTAARNGGSALRACASDVSAAAFADELLRAGALLPLSLPPRLQRPAYSAGASAATSPITSSSAAAHANNRSGRKHRGFDPFTAALEKVRRDGGAAAVPRRARSLSPLRATADASSAHKKNGNYSRAARPASTAAAQKKARAAVAARRARRGVRHLLCRVVMASAAVAPKGLWPRRKDGVSYRPGLLLCLGYGV